MKEIIKSKSHMITKLLVYQLAMSLLGFFVVSPFSGRIQLLAGIFSTLFYFSIVCYAVIEDGQKDFVSHNAGRMTGSPYTGFIYALISYIPTIIIVLFEVTILLTTNPDTLSLLKNIFNVLIRLFLMGMYLGIDTGLALRANGTSVAPKALVWLSNNNILFAIFLIIMPIVVGFTYHLAFKGKLHVDTTVKSKNKKNK